MWKDLRERAAWTFVEAFLVALPETIIFDIEGAVWLSILLSAVAAGLSAVKTVVVAWIKDRKPPDEGEIGGDIMA